MATYTSLQLRGTGSISENLSGTKTFVFNNPSGSSYFTMETVRTSSGFYDGGSPTNCSGSYVVSSSMSLITSSYISSIVVLGGGSSFTYTPADAVTGTTLYLRGTGEYSLTIS